MSFDEGLLNEPKSDAALDHSLDKGRRFLLGVASGFVLAATALLLPVEQEAEAAGQGKRVQHRADKRRQRHHHRLKQRRRQRRRDSGSGSGGPGIFQKGISMHLNNHLDQTTHSELGILISGSSSHCKSPAPFDMPPLTGIAIYDTQHPEAYSWVEDRYFFGFFNPETGLPVFWVGDGGSSKGNCHKGGKRVLNDTGLKENQSVTVTIADRKFVVTRLNDTDFKLFQVDIYAT
jgi:hypothetical protein